MDMNRPDRLDESLDTLLVRGLSRRRLLRGVGGFGAVLTVGGALHAATRGEAQFAGQSATPAASPVASGRTHPFKVGAFDLLAVSDGTASFPDPTQILFAGAPVDEVANELRELGTPDPWTEWVTPFTPVLVQTGQERVLIDTGIGPAIGPTAGLLQNNLRTAGIAPESIDIVVLTHGHPDHIGGAVGVEGAPAFPNARYLMSRADWEFWTNVAEVEAHIPASDLRDLQLGVAMATLPALRDRIELIEDGAEIVPGVVAIAAPGHSPGHLVLEIGKGPDRLLYGADTVLHPLHLEHPDWLTVFDTHPEPTVSTRRRILDLAASDGLLMTAYHMPFPGLGRVEVSGDTWRWAPA